MSKVSVEQVVNLPRKKGFDNLVQFGGLENILPDMTESPTLSSSGVGTLHTVKLTGGGLVIERLDAAFDERLFSYTITITFNDKMPFENYCAAVTLADAGHHTLARWESSWDAKRADKDEVKGMLTTLYGNRLEGLPKLA